MNDFENSIASAKQHIYSILESQREEEYGSNLEAATYVAARSQRSGEAVKGKQPVSRKERTQFNQQVKPFEERALEIFVVSKLNIITNNNKKTVFSF